MRKGIALLLAVLLCCLSGSALAHDVPDLSRTGTLNITMRYDGEVVPGGVMTLYRVGEVSQSGGEYEFIPTGDFADCGYSLEKVDSPALAKALAHLAQDFEGVSAPIGSDGAVTFENLELGLYLLVQELASKGYLPAEPFLVTIPMFEDGKYIYEVDASPKVEFEKDPRPTYMPRPDQTRTPDDDDDDDDDDEPEKLPQTGQMNWPVPALAVSGVCLFTVGWLLRFRKETYEK